MFLGHELSVTKPECGNYCDCPLQDLTQFKGMAILDMSLKEAIYSVAAKTNTAAQLMFCFFIMSRVNNCSLAQPTQPGSCLPLVHLHFRSVGYIVVCIWDGGADSGV